VHGWTALIVATAAAALELAGWSHRAVACLRFAGFKLPRNTCRPLESRSIAEFWNRYYYYFKEMLVDMFFYPTFLRYFKKRPRLRVFFATFMAAGVGNAIFHFFRQLDLLFTMGVRRATVGFTSYIVYCVVLATAIGVSQARTGAGSSPAVQPATVASRVKAFVCVWGLVVLLHPFGGLEERVYSFHARVSFLAHHLGMS
jgi:D-alanyl-lipoteichoic acid acyltransferase DltB (MBOAT superfamily)